MPMKLGFDFYTHKQEKKNVILKKHPDHNWDTYTHANAYSPTKGKRNWGWGGERKEKQSTSLQRIHLIKALPLSI